MKRLFYLVIAIVLTSLSVVACSKVGSGNGDDPNAVDQSDKVFPVITISRPAVNQVYMNGDSIIVQGKATDDRVVYKGKVLITNTTNNAVVAESLYESHALNAIDFRLAHKPVISAPTDFDVYVEFQDHGLNTVSATIRVKVNP